MTINNIMLIFWLWCNATTLQDATSGRTWKINA